MKITKTNKTIKSDWVLTQHGNYYLQLKGFAISYNEDVRINLAGRGETALILPIPKNKRKNVWGTDEYAILNGDHREAYENILSGGGTKEDCIEYYKNCEDKGFWSSYND